MNEPTQAHNSDDNLLAAISHLFGLLVAFIIWLLQKDKSRFVRFQALQALAFDAIEAIILFIGAGCMFALVAVLLAFGIGDMAIFGSQNNPTAEPLRNFISLLQGLPFFFACVFIPLVALFFVLRLVAAIQTLQGKNFHYPWLGRMVERAIQE